MTGLNVPTLETLRPEKLAALASVTGPCISVYLRGYRPGAQTKSMGALLEMYCQEAARQLQARHVDAAQISELLEPVENLATSSEFASGSHAGCAIFRAPDVFAKLDEIEVPFPVFSVGACLYLRPLLADLHLPAEFHLLKLSKKEVELLTCAHFRAEATDLPKGTPRTLDEALAFKAPDHDLENRSSAGNSTGAMRGVRFGTGSERENEQTHVADFFKAVDRGIGALGRGEDLPLVLAGVEEDTNLYRSASKQKNLLAATIAGAHKRFSNLELLRRAYGMIRTEAMERAAADLTRFKEQIAPARFSTDRNTILRAATEGRIGWLFINESAREFGVFDDVRRAGRVNWGEEDLLNVAAIETIGHGGIVYSLPAARIPEGAPAAAILRY